MWRFHAPSDAQITYDLLNYANNDLSKKGKLLTEIRYFSNSFQSITERELLEHRFGAVCEELNLQAIHLSMYVIGRYSIKRNQGMFDVAAMRKPDWVVVGDSHASYLKRQFPDAQYIRFATCGPMVGQDLKLRSVLHDYHKKMRTVPDELVLLSN